MAAKENNFQLNFSIMNRSCIHKQQVFCILRLHVELESPAVLQMEFPFQSIIDCLLHCFLSLQTRLGLIN